MRKILPWVVAVAVGACASSPSAPPAAIADLAPTGRLRAVINLGNPILANMDEATGQAQGVSVDLARELARRLGVEAEFAVVSSAGEAVDALASGKRAGAAYLGSFVEQMKASGFVADSLKRHNIEGAIVAPPSAVP